MLHARLSCHMGQFEEAAEDLNVSIARDPQNADSYRLRGYCWHRLGKMDLAIADYDEVLSVIQMTSGCIAYEVVRGQRGAISRERFVI